MAIRAVAILLIPFKRALGRADPSQLLEERISHFEREPRSYDASISQPARAIALTKNERRPTIL